MVPTAQRGTFSGFPGPPARSFAAGWCGLINVSETVATHADRAQ